MNWETTTPAARANAYELHTRNAHAADNMSNADRQDARAAAADAQRRADMMPSTYTYEGQFTPAQQETRRRFAAVAVALADDGFIIEDNSHVAELIERYAVAYAKASK